MRAGPDLDDIPTTIVFTGEQTRKGYHLNQFCMSLRRAENRARSSPTSLPTSTSGR